MVLGIRSRTTPVTTTTLKSTIGAALVGAVLLGGTFGISGAQDATPEASPVASPVAIGWVAEFAIEDIETDGDSTSVGVKVSDILEINVAAIESRPFVILQTENLTEAPVTAVVLSAPAGFDATGFTLPATVEELPEGVTPIASYGVAPGEQTAAEFADLAVGTYVLATDTGLAISFDVIEPVDLDVPDIFETPEGTPAS